MKNKSRNVTVNIRNIAVLLLIAVLFFSGTVNVKAAQISENTISQNGLSEEAVYRINVFVERFYSYVLDREADQEGMDYWIDQLIYGKTTGVDMAYGFLFSQECENRKLTNEQFVEVLYNTLLDRVSDKKGKNSWVSSLKDGMSREYVFSGFCNSVEYKALCGEYGITPGYYESTKARDRNLVITSLIRRFYQFYLGRNFDVDGLEYWCQCYYDGMSMRQISEGFVFSKEYLAMNQDDQEFVRTLYWTYLDRAAEQAGLEYWVDMLSSGKVDRATILDGFIESQEFKAMLNGMRSTDKIMSLGDSIAAGAGVERGETYQQYLADKLGYAACNYGFGGYFYADAGEGRALFQVVSQTRNDLDADVILLEAGINDFMVNHEIGAVDSTDTATVCGGMNQLIRYLETQFPYAEIVVISPWNSAYGANANALGYNLEVYSNAIVEVAKYNQLKYADIYHEPTLQFASNEKKYTIDGIHLNAKANQILADYLYEKLF